MSKSCGSSFKPRRKLPSIPVTERNYTFWPTFRGAVAWMCKNQDTIDTALNLLEIYPNLIRHRSCDRLWEFVSKVACHNLQTTVSSSKPVKNKKQVVNQRGAGLTSPVPRISVTDANDSSVFRFSRNSGRCSGKNVLICGNYSDDSWRILVERMNNLQVTCVPKQYTFDNQDCQRIIFENDSMVFLMDSHSSKDEGSLKLLKEAVTWNLPITFVRQPGYKLPDHFFGQLFDAKQISNTGVAKSLSYLCGVSIGENIHSTWEPKLGLAKPKLKQQRFLKSRPSLTGRKHSSSEERVTIDKIPGNFLQVPKRLGSGNRSKRTKSTSTSDDLVQCENLKWTLIEGYRHAILYDRSCVDDCKSQIEESVIGHRNEGLDDDIDSSWSVSSFFSDERPPSLVSSTTFSERGDGFDENDHGDGNIGYDKVNSKSPDSGVSSPLESKRPDSGVSSPFESDTVYIVFPDPAVASTADPKIVHWPQLQQQVSICPSVDSFGFQDVDLSRAVNQISWSSDDSS